MKKYALLSLLLLISTTYLFAEGRNSYTTIKTDEAIKIDGKLDEAVWKDASIASNFIQTIPTPEANSSYKSEVKIVYTNSAIYVAAKLYEPKEIISKQLTARDATRNVNADIFSVYLDTYDDHQNGYAFRVSSAGVQQDERLSGGSEYGDVSWDAIWLSKIQINEDGWTIEMEIPFSALRFAPKKEMAWGINFLRLVRKTNENSYWNKINVQQQGFLAQTGTLNGLKIDKAPVRLFLYPYLSTGYFMQEEAGGNKAQWLRSGGLDLKYGLSESFTLDMTLIPDFSQVVSDNIVRNLNPFEQQLTENRPFFTEGTELFNKGDLFYSRRIGRMPRYYYDVKYGFADTSQYTIEKNPNVTRLYNAFKISGRTKQNIGIGIFNAVGSEVHAKVKVKSSGEVKKITTEPLTNYNIVVVDKALKGQSSISFTNTNVIREGTARDANVNALMLNKFNKKESYMINAFAKTSLVTSKIGDEKMGSSLGLGLSKVAGKITFNSNIIRQSKYFDKSDMGLQYDFNSTTQSTTLNYNVNKPKWKRLQLYRINTSHTFSANTVPFDFKYYQANFSYFILFKNFWDVTYNTETKPIAPIDYYQLGSFGKVLKTFPYLFNSIDGSSDSRKKIFWAFNFGYGISNAKHTDYVYLNQTLRYRFSPKLEMSIQGEVTRDNGNIGYAFYDDVLNEPVAGQRNLREYNGEISLKYNVNPNMNFTARFRHYNSFITYTYFHLVDASGEWRNTTLSNISGYNENYNLQNVDVFYNWMFKPGSRIVVSYKQWLNDSYLLNDKSTNSYFNNVRQIIKSPHAFELAVRFIYFLDYNSLRKK